MILNFDFPMGTLLVGGWLNVDHYKFKVLIYEFTQTAVGFRVDMMNMMG